MRKSAEVLRKSTRPSPPTRAGMGVQLHWPSTFWLCIVFLSWAALYTTVAWFAGARAGRGGLLIAWVVGLLPVRVVSWGLELSVMTWDAVTVPPGARVAAALVPFVPPAISGLLANGVVRRGLRAPLTQWPTVRTVLLGSFAWLLGAAVGGLLAVSILASTW